MILLARRILVTHSSFIPFKISARTILLFATVLFVSICAVAQTQLDEYSGVLDATCPAGATGTFYTAKISNHWVYCDPLGHPYIHRGVYYVGYQDDHTAAPYIPQSWDATTSSKYPDAETLNSTAVARLRSWGFNGIGPGGYRMAYPYDPYGPAVATATPFINYFGNNAHISCEQTSTCKNLWYLYDPTIGTGSNYHLTDVYDPNYAPVVMSVYANDCNLSSAGSSNCYGSSTASQSPYFIGGVAGDSDYFTGFEAGVDFPTTPAGKWFDHAGWVILNSAPRQTMNPFATTAAPFTDITNHSKAQLATFLQNEYGSIVALNSAWGTNYTTFGSTAAQAVNESTGVSSTGSEVSFTLKHANVDRYSVLITIGTTAAGGDSGTPNSAYNLIGAGITSGSINYSTGAVTLTSTLTGAITVSYYYNGFGNGGTGLLDNYQPTYNNATTSPDSYGTAAYKADLDNFLEGYAYTFLVAMKNGFKTYAPNNLFLGPSSIGSWQAPARCPVLKAAGQILDVGQLSFDGSQAQLEFIGKCFGDKPYQNWYSVTANYDSDVAPYLRAQGLQAPVAGDYPTQAARGTQFQNDMTDYWNMCSSTTGSCPWVGYDWWAYLSYGFPQYTDFGLVSWRDNAYDGHDAAAATTSCSSPASAYSCGGEVNNYGNFLAPVTATNAALDADLYNLAGASISTTAATITSPTAGSTLTGTSASFVWKATGAPGTSYRLYLGTTAGASDLYNSGAISTTEANITGLPTSGATIYATLGTMINSSWVSSAATYKASPTPAPATLLTPTPGSQLASTSATFNWSAGGAVTLYQFALGSTSGGSDLYSSGQVITTAASVSGLPTTGTIYATLSSYVNGQWESNSYTYSASSSTVTPVAAALTSPKAGSTLTGSSATFTWTAGTGVTQYELDLGTTGVGSTNLSSTGHTTATTASITGIPMTGATLYARLWSYIGRTSSSADYTFTQYSAPAATPVFSLAAGTYTTAQTATISDATSGAAIYYTTNGTTPTAASTHYSGAITISATETLKAIAISSGYTTSAVTSAAYTISLQTPAPVFSLAPGTYFGAQTLKLTDSTSSATIYYTTNGATPTTSSARYSSSGIKINSATTVKAIAVASGYPASSAVSGSFIIAAAPTVSTKPASGLTTAGATLNGTVTANNATTQYWFCYGPTASSMPNSSAIAGSLSGASATTVSAAITGLKAKATYYFRIVATNGGGQTIGSVMSFTTR